MEKNGKVGIVGYGSYIPRNRIKMEEIAKVWGSDPASIKRGLMLQEKSVPGPDQDVITMSVEASRNALKRCNINPKDIGSIYVGSESHPYAVKPSGTTVAEAINATPDIHCADFEFACKAGTEGMFICIELVRSGAIKYGMAIGADTSQGCPGDALEYSASAGAAAFIFGKENVIAEVIETYSYMTDTPDFWRREYQFYPQHAGRFTGEPAYFKHITECANGLFNKSGMKPGDFSFAVFHQPNGKFPQRVGRSLGFTKEQMAAGLLAPTLGNTYSGSSPMGLTAILDISRPSDYIFMVSYGSGAGSDGFIFKVTEEITRVQQKSVQTRSMLDENKHYLSYGEYAKYRGKIKR